MKRAIVLSGGGSNGAYQIGVWKALRKLRIKYDIVTGTSVGAINGAIMTQKAYHKAYYLWRRLGFELIFDEKIQNDYSTMAGKKEVLKMYTKNIVLDGGMEVSKLENLIRSVINTKKIYKSNINYGLVTFKLSKLKPIEKEKKEIPENEFIDYIMASATCFPAFQKKIINDDAYIDGGYYDNLPINLAIKMGAEDVIAVDLNCIGIKQSTKKKNINITYISPRSKLGSFLVFTKDLAARAIDLGYNDTMKTFGKLDGNIYTFKKNHLRNLIIDYKDKFKNELTNFFPQKTVYNTLITNIIKILYKDNIPNDDTIDMLISCAIDNLGSTFNMDETKIHKIFNFNNTIFNKLDNLEYDSSKKLSLIKFKDNKVRIKYLYDKIKYCVENNKYKEIDKNILIFSKDFISALYLYIIKNY